ncbi:hypothetical protein BaRGS_00035677, partial [Batillaria attramentaria]
METHDKKTVFDLFSVEKWSAFERPSTRKTRANRGSREQLGIRRADSLHPRHQRRVNSDEIDARTEKGKGGVHRKRIAYRPKVEEWSASQLFSTQK